MTKQFDWNSAKWRVTLFLGSLCPGAVAPDRILSMGKKNTA